jgi:hypothetical protein
VSASGVCNVGPATLSNCGKFLKPTTTKLMLKGVGGRGNDLGYGNNVEDITMDNPQPSPKSWGFMPQIRMQFND